MKELFSRHPSIEDLKPSSDDHVGDFQMAVAALLMLHCPNIRVLIYPSPDDIWFHAAMTDMVRLSREPLAKFYLLHDVTFDTTEDAIESTLELKHFLHALQLPGLTIVSNAITR